MRPDRDAIIGPPRDNELHPLKGILHLWHWLAVKQEVQNLPLGPGWIK